MFFSNLNKCDRKAAILRVLPDYFKHFTGNKKQLPKPLTEDETNKTLNYADIHSRCEEIYPSIQITEKEVTTILNATKKTPNQCENWYMIRCGRITASVMKVVCSEKPGIPPLSFIKKIYY